MEQTWEGEKEGGGKEMWRRGDGWVNEVNGEWSDGWVGSWVVDVKWAAVWMDV